MTESRDDALRADWRTDPYTRKLAKEAGERLVILKDQLEKACSETTDARVASVYGMHAMAHNTYHQLFGDGLISPARKAEEPRRNHEQEASQEEERQPRATKRGRRERAAEAAKERGRRAAGSDPAGPEGAGEGEGGSGD